MNTTEDKWQIGFWQWGKGHKHPVQFEWFDALDRLSRGEECALRSMLTLRSAIRKIVPVRLDMCPVDGRAISATLPWIGLFFRFRPFHPRCIGYTVYDLDEFHKSRWYHHPANATILGQEGD